MEGIKYDENKLNITLIDIEFILGTLKVFEYGKQKYELNNWIYLEPERLYNAMFRHFVKLGLGEYNDKESGLPHLLHIAANCAMLYTLTKQNETLITNQQSIQNKIKNENN